MSCRGRRLALRLRYMVGGLLSEVTAWSGFVACVWLDIINIDNGEIMRNKTKINFKIILTQIHNFFGEDFKYYL